MQVSDVDVEQNSSSSISPPPDSPPNDGFSSDTIHVSKLSGGGVVNPDSANSVQAAHATNSNATTSTTTNTNGAAPEKPKRQRKKKEVTLGPDGKPVADEKPKKPRKPREPKDKTARANSSTTAAPRKKQPSKISTAPSSGKSAYFRAIKCQRSHPI